MLLRGRGFHALATVLTLVVSSACNEPPVTAPDALPELRTDATASLARAIAMGLRSEGVRKDVLLDMQASTLEGNRIGLAEYLSSASGRELLRAASAEVGLPEAAVLAMSSAQPDLALWMPIYAQRIRWTGASDVVVAVMGAAGSPPGGGIPAYSTRGDFLAIPITNDPGVAVLALSRADESRRAASRSWLTAGPAASELAINTIATPGGAGTRDLSVGAGHPAEGPQLTSGGAGIDVGLTFSDCYWSAAIAIDADRDFMIDTCEYELARAFAPDLIFAPGEIWRTREEAWAARVVGSYVQIIYLLSYHEDIGHPGDSEFIELFVQNVPGTTTWELFGGNLSAHYGTPGDSSEGLFYWEFEYEGAYRGAPRVWVAYGKHANYKSDGACDNGAFWTDDCDWTSTTELNVHPARNIGSDVAYGTNPGTALLDCTTSMLFAPGDECYWTVIWQQEIEWQCFLEYGPYAPPECYIWVPTPPFGGWISSSGATPYGEILWERGWKRDRFTNPAPNLTTWPAPPPPPPPTSLQASIYGPDEWVQGATWGYWCASVEAGTPPYSYEWSWDGQPVGTDGCTDSFYAYPGFHSLWLTVTDAAGATVTPTPVKFVTIYENEGGGW